MTSTTLTSWALLIWQVLNERGVDPRPFFAEAGLDPAMLGDGNARYPVDRLFKLWSSLKSLDDDLIGIEVGLRWNVTTFHALGFAWLASNSLKEAMLRFSRYVKLVNNSMYAEFEPFGSNYRFIVSSSESNEHRHFFGAEAGSAAILKMCRMLCGEQFTPLELHLMRPSSAGTSRLETLYRIPIHYSSDQSYMVISRSDAESSIPSGNSELARINDQVAEKNLNLLNKSDVSAQVRQSIIEHLPSGRTDEQSVADDLHMSMRTLQRKLRDDGQSFSKVVAEVRESLAMHYIDESHLSLTEIGYLLGFAEQASFTRAFKRWTGKSPSQYRKGLDKQPPLLMA